MYAIRRYLCGYREAIKEKKAIKNIFIYTSQYSEMKIFHFFSLIHFYVHELFFSEGIDRHTLTIYIYSDTHNSLSLARLLQKKFIHRIDVHIFSFSVCICECSRKKGTRKCIKKQLK